MLAFTGARHYSVDSITTSLTNLFQNNSGFNLESPAEIISYALKALQIDTSKSIDFYSSAFKLSSTQSELLTILFQLFPFQDAQFSKYTATRIANRLAHCDSFENKRLLLLEILARLHYDACLLGEPIVLSYPPLIQLELASVCNYRCIFCYQTDDSFSGKNSQHMGFLDISRFKQIIDECQNNIPYITFASRGEPTLNPHFPEMLRYCSGKFLDIKLNTNASLLNPEKCRAIMDTCDTVVFSIDTPNPDDYPSIRVNGDFTRVISNIELFNQIRSSHPRCNHIRTRASGVYFDSDRQDFDANSSFFSKLVDEVSFVQYHPWEKLYSFDLSDMSPGLCTQPFYRFFVWYDGTFNPCDMDYKSVLSSDSTLRISSNCTVKEAWESPLMASIRQKHLQGDRQSLNPCNICPIPL